MHLTTNVPILIWCYYCCWGAYIDLSLVIFIENFPKKNCFVKSYCFLHCCVKFFFIFIRSLCLYIKSKGIKLMTSIKSNWGKRNWSKHVNSFVRTCCMSVRWLMHCSLPLNLCKFFCCCFFRLKKQKYVNRPTICLSIDTYSYSYTTFRIYLFPIDKCKIVQVK